MPDVIIAARAAVTSRLAAFKFSEGVVAGLIYIGALVLAALPVVIGTPVTGVPLF
jgi:hypothetical protein